MVSGTKLNMTVVQAKACRVPSLASKQTGHADTTMGKQINQAVNRIKFNSLA
jgi:hypothetical protein